jgi:hypothetical protein
MEKLINRIKSTWTEMKLIFAKMYCIDKCLGQISSINHIYRFSYDLNFTNKD